MAILSRDAARRQIRVDAEVLDAEIDDLIAAAEQTIADHLGRPLIDEDLGWPSADLVPANVVHSIKLVLSAYYDDRSKPEIDWTLIDGLIGRYVINSFS